jgi:PhnB protein
MPGTSTKTVKPKKSAASKSPAAKTVAPKVKPVPDGMPAITPHLICAGAAEAIEFYKKAFGATETGRLPGASGRLMHASVTMFGSPVFLVDEMPEYGSHGPLALKGSPVTIHLSVENADAVFERVVKAGASVVMPLQDTFWGARYGIVADPFGHRWSIATQIRDVTPAEMQEAMKKMGA